MKNYLRPILIIGWLCGCSCGKVYDIRSGTPRPPFYRRHWTYISIALILIHLVTSVYLLSRGWNHFFNESTSEAIINCVFFTVWTLGILVRRAYFVFSSKLLVETLQRFQKAELHLKKVNSNFFYPVCALSAVCELGAFGADFVHEAWSEWEGNGQRISLAVVTQIAVELFMDLAGFGAKLFSNGLVLLLGQRLLEHYEELTSEFLHLCDTNTKYAKKKLTPHGNLTNCTWQIGRASCRERV